MNAARRKEIDRAIALIEEAAALIEQIKDAEQEAFDNMPEGLQQGERGQAMEQVISELEDAYNDAETVRDHLTEAKGGE